MFAEQQIEIPFRISFSLKSEKKHLSQQLECKNILMSWLFPTAKERLFLK